MFIRGLKRLAAILLLLFLIFGVTKGVLRFLPGDPVDVILAETGANIDPEVLRHSLGLDRPFFPATLQQISALLLHFDWGTSVSLKTPIGPLLLERFRSSAMLAVCSLVSTLTLSFLFAFFAHLPSPFQSILRKAVKLFSAVSVALPTAWIGPLLGLLLAVKLKIFTLTGGIALPVVTLTLALSGFWVRAIFETLDRELRSDVARTARAKGQSEWLVVWKHAFLPAAGPLLAYLGSQTGALFAGAVITETLFDRPGLGSLFVESIFKRDYPLIESVLMVSAASILIGNLVGDFLQEAVQPRLRMREERS